MDMKALIAAVENWADARGLLLNGGNPYKQLAKTQEELGEIAGAMIREHKDNIEDGIGDVAVCLIILAAQHGLRFEKCLERAYNEIKDRQGKTVGGAFIKEETVGDNTLKDRCGMCHLHITECLCD